MIRIIKKRFVFIMMYSLILDNLSKALLSNEWRVDSDAYFPNIRLRIQDLAHAMRRNLGPGS